MKSIYHELFDHVAFPVFATDERGSVTYKNPQSGKYQKKIRRRTLMTRHIKQSNVDHAVILAGDTPYPVGIRLSEDDGFLYLFLARFQYPDGKAVISRMAEHFGGSAMEFLAALKNSAEETPTVSRVYSDLLLITEQEIADLGIGYYSAEEILHPLFDKLGVFAVLGYRIEAQIAEDLRHGCAVYLSPHDLMYRFSHMLYLLMKISRDKDISVWLSSGTDCHQLTMQTATDLPAVTLPAEGLSALIPECEAEFSLLARIRTFAEKTQLVINEDGFATLTHMLPFERPSAGLALHSHTGFTDFEKLSKFFIKALEKRIRKK